MSGLDAVEFWLVTVEFWLVTPLMVLAVLGAASQLVADTWRKGRKK